MRKIILIIYLVVLIVLTIFVVITHGVNKKGWSDLEVKEITNFEECALATQIVMESYPRQCRFNNQTFMEDIGNELDKADLIRINNPRPNQKINTPITITGEARGNWFFEASFPVRLYDDNNNLLGSGIAQAQGDWMTTDFVPFSVSMQFSAPQTPKGLLILQKDNPSGLPENDDQLKVPVFFQ